MELHRKGRRIYGGFLETSRGLIYLAFRKPGEVYRKGKDGKFHKTVTESIEEGDACWAIDEETLQECRRRGVEIIGVWSKSITACWLTRLENFFDCHLYHMRDYPTRGGSRQRFLPLANFRRCNWHSRV